MDASRGAPPREGGCGEPRRGGHTTVHWLLHLQSHGGLAGYLVFANVKGTGRVAVFGFLWIVCATKWVQRFVFTKVLKHSLSYDMSAGLVSCYMDQMMLQLRQGVPGSSTSPEEKLKTCNYVIMGEERLVSEASGLRGYRLHGLDKVATVGTVGRVWRLADVEVEEGDVRPLLKSNPSLKRLCPSMALFNFSGVGSSACRPWPRKNRPLPGPHPARLV
uniref:Uncharacterized protein n=1 Tax=Aegilops tauschii subsp. strangulata TaxID=200361 RepID=A0A453QGR6_AEGTS